ncbi:MAG: phosphate ABC transporter substrate-binding protein [Deltaproteobacteria bacterium]|nr:phosphate ABC transporter substrate-binding protein [Deltaproteobacteria bacterium]
MMRKRIFHFVVAMAFLYFPLCNGKAQPAEQPRHTSGNPVKLLITGSSTMCPLIAKIARRFETLHPETRIEVQCGGSGRGISDAREGNADIGMVSRVLTEEEKDLYSFPLARDGISVILHKDNPVESLSDAQVADIYTGKITNWKTLGGRDASITVVNPLKGYSSVELFTHYFKIDYDDVKATMVAGDNSTRLRAVVDNPDAIAYLSSGEAERSEKAGAPINILAFNKVAPTSRNIITGNYPITRPLTLVTKDLPSGSVKTFIDYCLSAAVVEVIEQYDFIPYED